MVENIHHVTTNHLTIEMTDDEREKMYLELQNATIFDDWYMRLFMKDNIPCAERMIKICLNNEDLHIEKLSVQAELPGQTPDERLARLDIWAKDNAGNAYNIEIQNAPKGASPKRAFYYLARMVIDETPKGTAPEDRKYCYVIFITHKDYIGEGKPKYRLCGERANGKDSGFDADIVYINGAWNGDDDIGRLMQDLKNHNFETMHFKEFASRTKYIKSTQEVNKMSDF